MKERLQGENREKVGNWDLLEGITLLHLLHNCEMEVYIIIPIVHVFLCVSVTKNSANKLQ